MIVASDCRIATGSDWWQISCAVAASGLDVPGRLYYRLLAPAPPWVPAQLDAFVPPLLLLAAATSRPLVLNGHVSPALVNQAGMAARIWRSWSKTTATVEVSASARRAEGRRARRAGSFFSCGVDSFYTLLTLRSRYDDDDPRAVRHLVTCHGFDIPLSDGGRFDSLLRSVRHVAENTGTAVIPCVSNARDFVRAVSWSLLGHGPCLGGVALALGPIGDCIYVPAAYAYDEVEPNGVHPNIDPLWSSETVDVVHSGATANRATKIAYLSGSAIARRHLHVCWQNVTEQNCCRCEKCLRTMLELELHGVLAETPTFPLALEADAIRAISIEPHLFPFWQGWLKRARESGVNRNLVEAVEFLLARELFDRGAVGTRFNRLVTAPLARAGLTPERMKRIDSALFGGRITARFRGMRTRS